MDYHVSETLGQLALIAFQGIFYWNWEINIPVSTFYSKKPRNYGIFSLVLKLDLLLTSLTIVSLPFSTTYQYYILHYIKPKVNHILVEDQHGFQSGRSITIFNIVLFSYIFDVFHNHSQNRHDHYWLR